MSLLLASTVISSFHDFTNDVGALVLQLRRERVDVDAGRLELREHRFAVAAVGWRGGADVAVIGEGRAASFSGMVLTVNGAASASTYRTSEALGSLVPVLANSRRCGRPPSFITRW